MAQTVLSTEQKTVSETLRTDLWSGAGKEVRWMESLGLGDANCNIWNELAMGSYWTTQGTS